MRLILAALFFVPSPLCAQAVRVAVETPVLSAPAFTPAVSPALSSPLTLSPAAASLTGAISVLPAPAIAIAAPAAAVPAAFGPASAVAAVPAAADVPVEFAKAAADASFDGSDAGREAVAAVSAAPVSLDELVKTHSRRPLRGVFIQQEQEGTFLSPDPRDSSGNLFRWYRPVEHRVDLAAEVDAGMGRVEKTVYTIKRKLTSGGRDRERGPWNAWSTTARLRYLGKLEAAVVAERGADAAWKGKVSLLLERTKSAPDFLTKNPHMEPPPADWKDTPGARFLQPELVTDKNSGVSAVNEAIGRSKYVIEQTGHAGTQYHVFLKLSPGALRSQLRSLEDALQLFNDALFAGAAAESLINASHASLMPWHAGRGARVRKLVADASLEPRVSSAEDPDSEKHAFVGLRYWGMENGLQVVSLELRGTSVPWKARRQSAMGHGMDQAPPKPERDYSSAERWLTMLSLYAESVAQGRGPVMDVPPVRLSAADADAAFAAFAREHGVADGAFVSYSEFAARMAGQRAVPSGYLMPFASEPASSPSLRAFMTAALQMAIHMRGLDAAGKSFDENGRHLRYVFGESFKDWARGFQRRRMAQLETFVAAAAR
ncbi:MAG: hypothetical protein HY923_00435 [Elusimicrobia bacterium]|nr:hypothetical protein [Elusimicrobiota bacterium]